MQEVIEKAMDPVGASRELLAFSKSPALVDPLGESRSLMEALEQKPIYDPTAQMRRLTEVLESKATYDPMAELRRLMGAWHAEPTFDPHSKYREIVNQFAGVTAQDSSEETRVVEEVMEATSRPSTPDSLSNPEVVVGLVGMAWTCLWMISQGADVGTYGDLFIQAVSLALFFSEKP
jgi:hypothetical protein